MARIEPQLKEINLKTNKLVFDNGIEYEMPPEIRAIYEKPSVRNTSQRLLEEDRATREQLENIPGGGQLNAFTRGIGTSALGNFLKNYVTSPIIGGYEALETQEGQEGKGFLERAGENIQGRRIAHQIANEEIREKHPFTYKAGEWGGIISDIRTPLGRAQKSPMAVGGLFGLASSPPIYEDPEAALKGTATGAAIGYGTGKALEGLTKVANQRGALRKYAAESEAYPQKVKEAKESFRKTQLDKLNKASPTFRKGVSKESLKNQQFINQTLKVSEDAGTKGALEAEKFINTVESGLPAHLSAQESVKLIDVVEGGIAKASPEAVPFLQSYKDHLVVVLPEGAAYQAVKSSVAPQIIERSRMGGTKLGKIADKKVSDLIENMNPAEFYESLNSGELSNLIRNEMKEAYKEFYASRYSGKSGGKAKYLREVEERAEDFVNKQDWLQNDILSLRNEANDLYNYTQKRASTGVRNATGTPNPIVPEIPPTNQLELPPEPVPPQTGRLAQRFEKPFNPSEQMAESAGNSLAWGGLGKLLGFPGAMGKAAFKGVLGAGKTAAEGMGRFLTAPTRVSELTRESLKKGGIPTIVKSISSTYPSYDKGILLDPMDRRDAVSELENNPYIPLEQKALLQAKINRGRSIEELKEFKEEVK